MFCFIKENELCNCNLPCKTLELPTKSANMTMCNNIKDKVSINYLQLAKYMNAVFNFLQYTLIRTCSCFSIVTLLNCHIVTLLCIITLSHCHTVTLSLTVTYCHIVTLSHCDNGDNTCDNGLIGIVTLSHCHTVTIVTIIVTIH